MLSATLDTRAELLDRALDLIASHGYDGVGVQQICAAAGVTKPTLYHRFGSKRGLLEMLMDEKLAPLLQALDAEAAPGRPLVAALTGSAVRIFDFARRNPSFYRLYLTLWFAPLQSEAYQVAASRHERLFRALERIVKSANPPVPEPRSGSRAFTAAFLGALNNHIGLALNHHAALNAATAGALVHQFLYGALSRLGATP
jgi:TetR/AcrR family transcriptional regulator